MHGFSENQLIGAFLAIAVVLLVTRGMAELCRKLGQPEVLGELLGGFLIGPSVLGALFPGISIRCSLTRRFHLRCSCSPGSARSCC